jgi:outer membrane PBP1 activator LpoA protein
VKPVDGAQEASFTLDELPDYLSSLNDESLNKRVSGQLQAIDFLIAQREIDWAQSLVNQIPLNSTTDEQKLKYFLAQGKIANINGEPYLAHRYFFDDTLTKTLLLQYPTIAIELIDRRATLLFDISENLRSVEQRIFLRSFLQGDPDFAQLNHDLIWEALADISTEQLYSLSRQEKDTVKQGWYSLAALSKSSGSNFRQQIKDIQHWQEIWPDHPANQTMPADLQLIMQLAQTQAKNIAVLLPMTGKLASAGQALREGILAAYYDEAGTTDQLPVLNFIDTNAAEIRDIYQQAERSGAEFIIGPLAKPNVETLMSLEARSIPILALNIIGQQEKETSELTGENEASEDATKALTNEEHQTESHATDNLDDSEILADQASETEQANTAHPQPIYQFGLVIEQEAKQVAERAWRDGHRRALIISPSSSWGKRGKKAFADHWLELGGVIISEHNYTNRKSYSPLIETSVAVDQSKRRHQTLQRLLGTRLEFEPRRRKDIDFIFMLANNLSGKQLKPLLAFHFAGDIPVYATSHIFNGLKDTNLSDLNGVRFTSMPWVFNEDLSTRKAIFAYGKNTPTLQSFYAMGVDAYHIYPRLEQLTILPQAQFYGATGKLSVIQDKTIYRQQTWAEVQNNNATELTTQKQDQSIDAAKQ